VKYQNGFGSIELETILAPYNVWWKSTQFDTFSFKRPVFSKIYKDLFTLKQILSITGPRRIGKTTLLKQIVKELIDVDKVDPTQIVYFSFDDPLLVDTHIKERFFDDLIKWADLKHKDKIVYFFLDEIQKFERWELYLKKYYDLAFPCRFIISGSASSPIFKKSRESLMGRIKEYHLAPFSFKEFAYFNKGGNSKFLDFISLASEFGQKLQLGSLIHWKSTGEVRLPIDSVIMSELNDLLDKYFVEGGFPETWAMTDVVAKQAYLFDNQIQKVIFEDLVIATEFRKPENIKRFYLSLIEQPGQEINLEKASMRIGVSRAMLEKYLPLLEMTDLVRSLPKFSKRPLKFRRGSVKCYLLDLALRNAILKLDSKILEDKDMLGYYAENLVFNALRSFEGCIELSFYKEQRREVDFVVNLGGKRYLPIEVKYRDSIDNITSIKYFIEKHSQKFGIVVTKNFEKHDEEDKLLFIPLSIFLLFF
jgi:predicted AAA+ superfamily ATPase